MPEPFSILSTRLLDREDTDQFPLLRIRQIPFIDTVIRTNDTLSAEIRQFAERPVLGIFTSRHAVEAVLSVLGQDVPSWDLACMDGATRKALADHFGEERIISTAAKAAELAGSLLDLLREDPDRELIFFCGNRRLDELPVILQREGRSVTDLVVYDTSNTPVRVNEEYRAIVFFSPSAAESFYSANSTGPGTLVFTIGETTAKAVRKLTRSPVRVSREHSVQAMLQLVMQELKTGQETKQ